MFTGHFTASIRSTKNPLSIYQRGPPGSGAGLFHRSAGLELVAQARQYFTAGHVVHHHAATRAAGARGRDRQFHQAGITDPIACSSLTFITSLPGKTKKFVPEYKAIAVMSEWSTLYFIALLRRLRPRPVGRFVTTYNCAKQENRCSKSSFLSSIKNSTSPLP